MDLSIIVPLYNSEVYLPRLFVTLENYLNKGKTEIIFIDDHSSDNTCKLLIYHLGRKGATNVIILKNDENRGPSYTRNCGLRQAKGEYIAYLDGDDAWHKDKLKVQIPLMKKYGALLCGTRHQILTDESFPGERQKKLDLTKLKIFSLSWPGILFVSPFATPSVVIHHALKEYFFDENLRFCEEYNLWKRITYKHRAIKIDYPLTYTFKHDYLGNTGSLSTNLWEMQKAQSLSFWRMMMYGKYSGKGNFLLGLGFIFSQVKYIKRVVQKRVTCRRFVEDGK